MMNNELPTPPAQETLKPCPFCGAKQAGALAARASPAQAEGESNVAPQELEKCTGPFTDARDCPVHGPRKRSGITDFIRGSSASTPPAAEEGMPEEPKWPPDDASWEGWKNWVAANKVYADKLRKAAETLEGQVEMARKALVTEQNIRAGAVERALAAEQRALRNQEDAERFAAWFGPDDDMRFHAITLHHDHTDPGQPDTIDSWRTAIDAAMKDAAQSGRGG